MPEFTGDEIKVRFAKKPGPPTSFVWRGDEHIIVEIEAAHQKLDFKKPWYRRRHRDNYVVRTEAGDVFRMYFHRGYGRRYWVLCEQLDD